MGFSGTGPGSEYGKSGPDLSPDLRGSGTHGRAHLPIQITSCLLCLLHNGPDEFRFPPGIYLRSNPNFFMSRIFNSPYIFVVSKCLVR